MLLFCNLDTQITREIDHALDYYQTLHPVIYLSYEREAYYERDGGDFRVTFDDNILCRRTDLSLEREVGGTSILPEDRVLALIETAVILMLTGFVVAGVGNVACSGFGEAVGSQEGTTAHAYIHIAL